MSTKTTWITYPPLSSPQVLDVRMTNKEWQILRHLGLTRLWWHFRNMVNNSLRYETKSPLEAFVSVTLWSGLKILTVSTDTSHTGANVSASSEKCQYHKSLRCFTNLFFVHFDCLVIFLVMFDSNWISNPLHMTRLHAVHPPPLVTHTNDHVIFATTATAILNIAAWPHSQLHTYMSNYMTGNKHTAEQNRSQVYKQECVRCIKEKLTQYNSQDAKRVSC